MGLHEMCRSGLHEWHCTPQRLHWVVKRRTVLVSNCTQLLCHRCIPVVKDVHMCLEQADVGPYLHMPEEADLQSLETGICVWDYAQKQK